MKGISPEVQRKCCNKVYFGVGIIFDQFSVVFIKKIIMWEGHYLQFMENHTVLSFKEVNCKRSHKVPSRAFNSAFDLTESQKSNSELFRNKHEMISSPLFSFSNFNFFKNFQKHFSSAEFSASLRFIRRQIKLLKYHLKCFSALSI